MLSNSNTYGGGTTLSGGTLTVGSNSALGSGVVTLIGGTLQTDSNAHSFSNSLIISAPGAGVQLTGTLTFTGPNTITANSNLVVNNTTTLTGGIAGTSVTNPSATITATSEAVNTVTITTAAAHNFLPGQLVTVSGVTNPSYNGTFVIVAVPSATTFTYANIFGGLANSAGGAVSTTANLIQSGPGNLVLTGGNDYNGTTTISNGTLTLSGGGTATSSLNFVVDQGGTLTLDNTGTNVNNRLAGTTTLTLNGGTVNFLGNASAASTLSLGAIYLNVGNSTFAPVPGTGQTATVNVFSLVQNAGATLALPSSIGSASNQLLITAAPRR